MAAALSIITKVRPNTNTPFKDPSQPLNYPTWPGYVEFVSGVTSDDGLTEILTHRWENRTYFENPVLTDSQQSTKAQGEQWVANNNISVSIQIVDE